MTVLLIGSNGFVGRSLLCQFRNQGLEVRSVSRRSEPEINHIQVPDFSSFDFEKVLKGIDLVVYVAGRHHRNL